MSNKILCDCGKTATWVYLPYSSVKTDSPYYCDECVPRGCTCNYENILELAYEEATGEEGKDWHWVEKDKTWERLDDSGKPYPCCEYDYEKEGFDELKS